MEAVSREEIFETFKARGPQYGGARVMFVGALSQGQRVLCRGVVEFLREPPTRKETRDYGSLVLSDLTVPVPEGWNLIAELMANRLPPEHGLVLNGKTALGLPTWHSVSRSTPFASSQRVLDWPSTIFLLRLSNPAILPHGPIVRRELPIVEDAFRVVDDWFGFDSRTLSESASSVVVMLPDYRARLDKVVFSQTEISVQVEPGLLALSELELRALVHNSGRVLEPRATRSGKSFRLAANGVPEQVYVFLVDPSCDAIIDWAEIRPKYGDVPKGVAFAIPEQHLLQVINGGENDHVEFKSRIENAPAIVETIVAFANGGGGKILIGVDNEGKVVGADAAKSQQRLQEWIERYCEPVASVSFATVRVEEKTVLVVDVQRGTEPPYMNRDNGVVYVRRGATDRPAKRGELDRLYERPTPNQALARIFPHETP